MTVRVKAKNEKMVVIRFSNVKETNYILEHLAKLKWLPQNMRPEITVKNLDGDEVIIPKPKPPKNAANILKEAQESRKEKLQC